MYDRAGFGSVVDLTTAADSAPLADGLWDISLAARVPDLLHALRAADPDYVLLDGPLAECGRSGGGRADYSYKRRRQGVNEHW